MMRPVQRAPDFSPGIHARVRCGASLLAGKAAFSNDFHCFAGADTVATGGPGALLRGGDYGNGTGAGPFGVGGFDQPLGSFLTVSRGFRCAR